MSPVRSSARPSALLEGLPSSIRARIDHPPVLPQNSMHVARRDVVVPDDPPSQQAVGVTKARHPSRRSGHLSARLVE
jgi:hypothetical protein